MEDSYKEKCRQLDEKIIRLQEQRVHEQNQRERVLAQTREKYMDPNNAEILALLQEAVHDNIRKIKEDYQKKLQDK